MMLSRPAKQGILAINSAGEVKTPKFSRMDADVQYGRSPYGAGSVDTTIVLGHRGKALPPTVAYTFVRIDAVEN